MDTEPLFRATRPLGRTLSRGIVLRRTSEVIGRRITEQEGSSLKTVPDEAEPMIVTTCEDRVWTIRINRPERMNALNPAAIELLRTEIVRFRDDASAFVCILTGTGDRAFCTGADLQDTLPPDTSFAQALFAPEVDCVANGNYVRALDLSRLVVNKPVIAAVNGYAMGGGCEIALASDICIASDSAIFSLPEVRIGSIPAVGGIQHLVRSIGKSSAMSMILTGGRIPADEAARMGIVSEVIPQSRLMERAHELAREIASNAPLAVRAALMLANEGRDLPLSTALLLEQLAWGVLRDTEDRVEGRKAFAEKRAPRFTGA